MTPPPASIPEKKRPYDEGLVADARDGNPIARERLLNACCPEVLRLCRAMGGPTVDAEDAAQDVLIVVTTRLAGLRDPSCFHDWLYSIIRRVLATHRRRAWWRSWIPGIQPQTTTPTDNPEEAADRHGRAARIRALLARLPGSQRLVMEEIGLAGFTGEEVAQRHQIPHPTVRRSRQRGEEKLRRWAQEDEDLAEFIGTRSREETP